MELLIVSGLSGAGKSVAMNALEDIGFFCIDNVPAGLLPSITAFSEAGDSQLERVALSMDVRGCRTSEEIKQALHKLDEQGILYKVLFLDAPDDVLMRRYSETRRRHPISIAEGISTREALAKERQILQPFRERADYTINTEFLSTAQNKERICNLFAPDGGAKAAMRLTVMSFGFKFGIPEDANLVLDVRCLPNPFYIPELKHKTGLDEEVVDFVMGHPEAKELLRVLHTAERLKDETRHCYTSGGRRESVAEHSWRLALTALFLRDEFPALDMDRVIRMCLIHDLGECFTGDIPSFLKSGGDEERERSALETWVASLPAPYSVELKTLYAEMDALETDEARLYKALDKLEAVIQHNESDIATWLPREYELNLTYADENVAFSDYLKRLREEIRRETRDKIAAAEHNRQ